MISKVLLALGSLIVLVAITQVSATGTAAATRLLNDLKKGYEKIFYPDDITLYIGITYVCAYMDVEHYRFNSRVIERYHWIDNRLHWNPKDYEGVEKVSIPSKYIWTPDVHLQNAIMTEDRDEVNAVVLANGSVYWIPPVNYRTRCSDHEDKDDSYHCTLTLGSWTYDAKSIPLELFLGGFDTKMYLDNCPYVIDNAHATIKTTKYDCCPNPYSALSVKFDVHKRKKDEHDDDDDDSDDSDSDSDDDDDHHGHRPRYSKDCVWPHC